MHPFYIDAISAKWAMRIEAVEQEADLYPMRREIVEDYCRLAQTRSMASYSPNVRSMLTYVQFNLAEGISLEAIARQLGVNASYLSSQFNREVGKSLPEYVSEKRIAVSYTHLDVRVLWLYGAGRLLSVLHRFQRCDARTVHYPEENVRP